MRSGSAQPPRFVHATHGLEIRWRFLEGDCLQAKPLTSVVVSRGKKHVVFHSPKNGDHLVVASGSLENPVNVQLDVREEVLVGNRKGKRREVATAQRGFAQP